MPIIEGRISEHGAVIDVVVGVSRPQQQRLARLGKTVPGEVHVRALIDTGAMISAFAPRVFAELQIPAITSIPILTPSTPYTQPYESDLFEVSVSLAGGGQSHSLSRW